MSCKHLINSSGIIPGDAETGGSLLPERVHTLACRLDRRPHLMGWATKCRETPREGPCWFWVQMHKDKPDLLFLR
jgi:hypothetical protein